MLVTLGSPAPGRPSRTVLCIPTRTFAHVARARLYATHSTAHLPNFARSHAPARSRTRPSRHGLAHLPQSPSSARRPAWSRASGSRGPSGASGGGVTRRCRPPARQPATGTACPCCPPAPAQPVRARPRPSAGQPRRRRTPGRPAVLGAANLPPRRRSVALPAIPPQPGPGRADSEGPMCRGMSCESGGSVVLARRLRAGFEVVWEREGARRSNTRDSTLRGPGVYSKSRFGW